MKLTPIIVALILIVNMLANLQIPSLQNHSYLHDEAQNPNSPNMNPKSNISSKQDMSSKPDFIPPAPSYTGKIPICEDRVVRQLSYAKGSAKILVLTIDFSDLQGDTAHDDEYFQNMLFNESNETSMRSYFRENSYGRFDIFGFTGGQWFHDSNIYAYYGADSASGIDDANGPVYRLVTSAVTLAAPYIDYSNYDSDSDGYVDHLIIVHAGNDQAQSGNPNDIWSHAWYDYDEPAFNGVKIGPYTMLSEYDAMGVYAHEFAHDLGLPDLYDYDYDSDGVGLWSLMASGVFLNNGITPAHLDAWSKYKLGWVDVIDINASMKNITIPCVETNGTASVYRFWLGTPDSSKEYFLIENRQKIGFDRYLPGGGLLIWHIDENMPNNDDQNHKMVDLEEASGIQHLDTASDMNIGDENDPWKDSVEGFWDLSNPNSKDYSGNPSGLGIRNISASSENMTFTIECIFNDLAVENIYSFYNYIEEKKESQFWVRLGNRGINAQDNILLRVIVKIADGAEIMNQSVIVSHLSSKASNITEWKWTPPITGKYYITARVEPLEDEIQQNNFRIIEINAVRIFFEDHVYEPAMTNTNWTHGSTTSIGTPDPLTDLWHIVTQDVNYGKAHSPMHSWWCGYETTGSYQRSHYYYLESKVLDLRNAEIVYLLFYHQYDISAGFIGLFKDQALVEYRIGNTQLELSLANWVQIGNYSGRNMLWKEQVFDISTCAGKYVQIRFRLYSNFLLLAGGWYVDDIMLFGKSNVRQVDLYSEGSEVYPGNQSEIIAEISNLGNLRDSYSILFTALPQGWTATVSQFGNLPVEVSPLCKINLTIEIEVPSNALAGSIVNLTISAVSQNVSSVRDSVIVSFVVKQTFGILLECLITNQSIEPGYNATFEINVTNIGNGLDLVTFEINPAKNASLDLSNLEGFIEDNHVEMHPFSNGTFFVTVSIPQRTNADTKLVFNISATSSSGYSVSIEISVNVKRLRSISIECKTPIQSVLPGGAVQFLINVSNNGNGLESIILSYNSSNEYYISGNLAIVLSSWTSAELLVTVTASSDITIKRHDIQIIATCGNLSSLPAIMSMQVIAPDLKVGSITFSNEHPTAGQNIKVYVSVFNNGSAQADGVTVELFALNGKVGLGEIGIINKNQWQQYTFKWNAKSGYIKISAYAKSSIKDIDEKDNVLEREIYVKASSKPNIDFCTIGAIIVIGVIIALLVVYIYSKREDETEDETKYEFDVEAQEVEEVKVVDEKEGDTGIKEKKVAKDTKKK